MCVYVNTHTYLYISQRSEFLFLSWNLKTRGPKEGGPGLVRGFKVIPIFASSFFFLPSTESIASILKSAPWLWDGCRSSSHHICILGKKEERLGERGRGKGHMPAESGPLKEHSLSQHWQYFGHPCPQWGARKCRFSTGHITTHNKITVRFVRKTGREATGFTDNEIIKQEPL